jgi:hypothetical protein
MPAKARARPLPSRRLKESTREPSTERLMTPSQEAAIVFPVLYLKRNAELADLPTNERKIVMRRITISTLCLAATLLLVAASADSVNAGDGGRLISAPQQRFSGPNKSAGGTGAATVATNPVVVRGKIDSTYMLPQGGSADRTRALQRTGITDTGPNQQQQDIEQRRRDVAERHKDAAQKAGSDAAGQTQAGKIKGRPCIGSQGIFVQCF